MMIIFLWFLCAATLIHGNMNAVCNEKDALVLSIFKQSIQDPYNSLSSWSLEQDCCNWRGVQCNNITGRVTMLQLRCRGYDYLNARCLFGAINFSLLLELEFLSFLDLSRNGFEVIDFESTLASFKNQSSREGKFSNLLYLDLSYNYYLQMDNLRWVSHLSSLKYLNLSGVHLNNETLWLQQISSASFVELRLSNCSLNGINPSHGYVNFTSLVLLDISQNYFNHEMPKWLFNISSRISHLDLSYNDLWGQLPASMLNFQHLNYLSLRENKLNGSIPKWIGQFQHLRYLDLSENLLSGPIPATIGNLSSLIYLVVNENPLNGSLPNDLGQLSKLEVLGIFNDYMSGNLTEKCLANLSNLKLLMISSFGFSINFGTHWKPPFQLEQIAMRHCKMGPEFPSWLYSQRSLSYLDISSTGLSFNAEGEFWSFVTKIDVLYLSNNSIRGDISTTLITSSIIELQSNNFSGGLPRLSPNTLSFNIANNSFSGPIHTLLCLNITQKHDLQILDMSHNLLSGEIPDCWVHFPSLTLLHMGSNNLSGKVPDSMGLLVNLRVLRLGNNSLSGNVPYSLKYCKFLWYLDLQFNEFTGIIPSWISHWSLQLFLLRSNKFSGNIPSHICQSSNLIVLDLANNRLSGPIPQCLYNITLMAINTQINLYWLANPYYGDYTTDLPLFVKGNENDYKHAIRIVRIVDFSSNDLSGSIPSELFSLIALQSLNLSHNHLTGNVSSDIGHMRFLESLDLSSNLLSGEIPQGMSSLSFLNHLNLSYNNFNGRIPLGTQLQSFEASSYTGNPRLCGPPLPNYCPQEDEPNGSTKSMEVKDGDEFKTSFQLGMGVGFASGFWVVCGTIFFIRRWRHAFFKTLDDLYVLIVMKSNRFF
ncbi:hypothetical protein RIF29_36039 [Crotalaria pallida]|uniref:Leucine-rich repeat-containing N-terminal plant-type domain-containing protein n=1 Tax=Crotalaria pallida TaxID=3830 RepID=A0AAN9EAL8_CROPI